MLVTGITKKGGRSCNEDAYGEARAKGVFCAVVADGLGGHTGGAIASKMAVNTILERFKENPEFSADALRQYIMAASDAIAHHAAHDPENVYMSSTVVVLLQKGGRAIWANVGDSRLYRFHDADIAEVTEDHSLAFLDFMSGIIEYDDIRNSENQNKLTSALGIGLRDMNISKPVRVDSSTAFLLCTDGWWEYVPDEDMENILRQSATTRQWLERMMELREANAPEGSDNYTAVAIMV